MPRHPDYPQFAIQARCTPAFRGPLAFLSNLHPAPVFGYASNEHAYVAAKTVVPKERAWVKAEPSPYKVKALGRTLTLRPDWDRIKLEVMATLVREKFTRHPDLRALLLATEDLELVEFNTWRDTFWGRCHGVGENHLGRILMDVRAVLR